MFITVHAATGALIGTEITNPAVSFLVNFALHFLMDIIPHGDRELGKRFFGLLNKKIGEEEKIRSMAAYAMLDAIVLIFFLLYAFKNLYFIKDDGVIWGIIGGIVPDLLVALYMLTKSRALKWFFNFHRFMHHLFVDRLKNDIPLKIGLVMQMIIFATLVVLLHEVALGGPLF